MKQLTTLLLAAALAVPLTSMAASAHDSHGSAETHQLQLNAGKKWETDAPLRQAMSNIRQAMASNLHAIHENRLSANGYGKLAQKVEVEVGNIVANCKLSTQADEQLHIVIAELPGGAEHMAGTIKGSKRQKGAVQVIGALEKYATYFDDPGFQTIQH